MTNKSSIFRKGKGLTLIEILVVIAVIAILLGILMPSLLKARQQTQLIVCASNLRNIGTAIHTYAHDFEDAMPFGPEAPPPLPGNFYPVTGMVTSLISLENKSTVGLGLLLDGYLAEQPKVLFCPATDQRSDAEKQLARVGREQAQCDYYYRHASVTSIPAPLTFRFQLSDPQMNRNGRIISALAMDVQFLAHPSFKAWGVVTRTAHHQENVNVLLLDGRVIRAYNQDNQYLVDCSTSSPETAPEKILAAFEKADELR